VEQKHITAISLISILIGLATLYFTLPEKFEQTDIKIKGTIQSVEEKEKFTIISFKTKDVLHAITFDKTKVQKGDEIEIYGRLQEYNRKVEIIADKIVKK